jgi:hypothetical protein
LVSKLLLAKEGMGHGEIQLADCSGQQADLRWGEAEIGIANFGFRIANLKARSQEPPVK